MTNSNKPPPGGNKPPANFDALGAVRELEQSYAHAPAADKGNNNRYTDMLEAEIETLNQEKAALEARTKKAELHAAESAEEVSKSRRRLEADASQQLERRTHKILLQFLEILDDLERGLTAARQMDHNPDVIKGIELVRASFLAKLAQFGVVHIDATGHAFDPAIHEAVGTIPAVGAAQKGIVIGVAREGYRIHSELLRAPQVVVGK